MHKMPPGPCAYCDVDDTLIVWSDEAGKQHNLQQVQVVCRGVCENFYVNHHNLEYLKKLAVRGHAIYVWSAGGSDWAEAVCKALKIEQLVWAVGSKPTYYIDDHKEAEKIVGKYKFYEVDGKYIGGSNGN